MTKRMLEIVAVTLKVRVLFVIEYSEFILISKPLLNQDRKQMLASLHVSCIVQMKETAMLVPAVMNWD